MPGTAGTQTEFAKYFASYTGLAPRVVEAWLLQEQPPGSPAKPGSNDWLNIETGPHGGSGVGSAEESYVAKLSPKAAAEYSASWLKANQPSIAGAAGKGEKAQAEAIVNSGWAASKYGGISKFWGEVQSIGTPSEVARLHKIGSEEGVEAPLFGVFTGKGVEGAEGAAEEAEQGAVKGITGVPEFLEAISNPSTWLRLAEGVGGIVLFMVGLKTLTKGTAAAGAANVAASQGHAVRKGAKRVAEKAVEVAAT